MEATSFTAHNLLSLSVLHTASKIKAAKAFATRTGAIPDRSTASFSM
jgi:hypothetical protein